MHIFHFNNNISSQLNIAGQASQNFQPEDCLVGRCAEIKHPIVQTSVLVHLGEVALLIIGDPPACILDLQRQLGVARGHNPDLWVSNIGVKFT